MGEGAALLALLVAVASAQPSETAPEAPPPCTTALRTVTLEDGAAQLIAGDPASRIAMMPDDLFELPGTPLWAGDRPEGMEPEPDAGEVCGGVQVTPITLAVTLPPDPGAQGAGKSGANAGGGGKNGAAGRGRGMGGLNGRFGAGGGGFAPFGRNRFRPYNPGLVPEPGTWALMIAGFGLVGARLRRARPAFHR